ncbi:MAG: hypothetical protein QXT73_02485 [Candidatus Methanomethylicaceae archaeon]
MEQGKCGRTEQADITDALKDGRIQASIVGSIGVPVQWIVDLSQVRDIKIISLPDDAISKITSVSFLP